MNASQNLAIRIDQHSMAFAVTDPTAANGLVYEPYQVKNGMSVAANLRKAFMESELLQGDYSQVEVFIDTAVLMVPIDEFHEEDIETVYHYTFYGEKREMRNDERVTFYELTDVNAVAVFAVNKDLQLVIEDHFANTTFIPLAQPVWNHLHRRSFTGTRHKLYAFFHDKKMELFCFTGNRFRYVNTFQTERAHDALYFILYVWKQLGLNNENDELHLAGNLPKEEWLTNRLRLYLQRAFVIDPTAEFNRTADDIKDIPYDLLAWESRENRR